MFFVVVIRENNRVYEQKNHEVWDLVKYDGKYLFNEEEVKKVIAHCKVDKNFNEGQIVLWEAKEIHFEAEMVVKIHKEE